MSTAIAKATAFAATWAVRLGVLAFVAALLASSAAAVWMVLDALMYLILWS